MNKTIVNVRENLSIYAHEAWSGWMNYMFAKSVMNADGTLTIPKWAVERWKRQANTEYSNLPESEKELDREEADRMLALMENRNEQNQKKNLSKE